MPLLDAPLSGRQREAAYFNSLLDGLVAGSGGVMLLTGEEGSGKTRLAAALLDIAVARGLRSGWGHAGPPGLAAPFHPWNAALSDMAHRRPGTDCADQPDLIDSAGPIAESAPDWSKVLLATGAYLERMARSAGSDMHPATGLVLILDDVDQADAASLALFAGVAHRAASLPLLLLGTAANEPRSPAARQHLASAVRARGAHTLDIQPLDLTATETLLAHLLHAPCEPESVRIIHQRAGGNPRLILELGRLLGPGCSGRVMSAVPIQVRQQVRAQLDGLSPRCQEALSALAALEPGVDLHLLAAVLGQDTETLLDTLAEAERGGFLAATPGEPDMCRFRYPLVRDALASMLTAVERSRLHLCAAEIIAGRGEAPDVVDPARLAGHYAQALMVGGAGPAIEVAQRAAAAAWERHDYAEAARLYRTARLAADRMRPQDRSGRFELLLREGQAAAKSGLTGAAQEALRDAANLARELHDPARLAAVALSFTVYEHGDALAREINVEARALLPRDQHELHLRLLLSGRQPRLLAPSERLELEQAAAAAQGEATPVTAALSLAARYYACWQPAALAERLDLSANLTTAVGAAGDFALEGEALCLRALDLAQAGEFEPLPQISRALLALAARTGDRTYRATGLHLDIGLALAGGATEEHRYSVEVLQSGQHLSAGELEVQISRAYAKHADFRLLAEHCSQVQQQMSVHASAAPLLAACLAAAGDNEGARALVTHNAAGYWAGLVPDSNLLGTLTVWADVVVSLQDRARAGELLERLLPFSGQIAVHAASFTILGAADRAIAELASLLRRWELAASHYELALAMHERCGARLWGLRTRIEYAAMLLTSARPNDFDDSLRLAQDAIHEAINLCQPHHVERARSLAARAGQAHRLADTLRRGLRGTPAREPDRALPDGITRREAEILRSVAAGRHNTEIAAELRLSPLTVARHITNLYAKIGARGRVDATAYALRQGLVAANWPGDEPAAEPNTALRSSS